jgi:membrane associated rhomboid family serine protease
MIPLRDDVPSRTTPYVTYTLIAINTMVFFYELSLGARLEQFTAMFGVVPAAYFTGEDTFLHSMLAWTFADHIVPIFTSMFLHGGWVHLFGNKLYLWIFGDNVEDRLGHLRYLVFYLLCGLLGALAHIYMSMGSEVPTIGASGAIAGVLGAYVMLYPKARVAVLFFVFFFVDVIWLPALVVLGGWFVIQFFNGTMSLSSDAATAGGTAYWAHIGGFVAGAVLVWVFRRRMFEIGGQ